jgi:hypothetical protein
LAANVVNVVKLRFMFCKNEISAAFVFGLCSLKLSQCEKKKKIACLDLIEHKENCG